MSQGFGPSKNQNYFSSYSIMEGLVDKTEALVDASEILRGETIAPQDKKDIYQSLKGMLKIKYKDFQNKDSRRLLKQLVDLKLKEMKKLKGIIKNEKKRRKEDNADKKQAEKIKEVGKKVRKESQKDKGKLGKLIKAIHSADPLKDKYVVATVEFYDGGSKHFTITPFNKEKIIEHLRELSKGKEVKGEVYFSDAVGDYFIPGKRVRSFKLVSKDAFDKEEKDKYTKNTTKQIKKSVRAHSSHMFI